MSITHIFVYGLNTALYIFHAQKSEIEKLYIIKVVTNAKEDRFF